MNRSLAVAYRVIKNAAAVGLDLAVAYLKCCATGARCVIVNAATFNESVIAFDRAIIDCQCRVVIINAAADVVGKTPTGVAVGYGQSRNRDSDSFSWTQCGTRRRFALPLIARLSAPGPEIVMFLVTSNSPLVKPMVPVTAKPIMSPLFASASAWRNESGPLSFVLVTVIVGGVGVGDGYFPQYLPPVFKAKLVAPAPPQTIISLPVHTAV